MARRARPIDPYENPTQVLAPALSRYVDGGVRDRGLSYFRAGTVTLSEGGPTAVAASVRGSERYRVTLDRAGGEILAWCTCPYCEDRFEPCKHIWATLLAADAKGYLQGNDRKPPRALDVVPLGDREERDDDDEDDDEPAPAPARRPAGAKPRTTATVREWEATLSRLRTAQEKPATTGSGGLTPGQEIVYLADLVASLAAGALVLEVATRARKKDGAWSKPKGRRFGLADIAGLPDPDDRRALALLAGGREATSGYGYGYGYSYGSYYDSAPAKYHLTAALAEAILPLVCGTGRCLERPAGPDDPMRPLAWDDAGPWEFWLKVAPAETGPGYALTGELRRGDERLALAAPDLLLAGGLVFWDGRVARLHDFDSFEWISLLRSKGEVRAPGKRPEKFLEDLLRLPRLPRIELPEALRFEEVTVSPRPVLTVKARDPRGWSAASDPKWLVGELAFDYDGQAVPATSPARSVYQAETRRLLRRDPEAERALAARLDEVGFHRRTDYGRGESLELLAKHLPKVARTLLHEGWRVEAEGKLYRHASEFRIEVTSGIDWFELHGGADFGGVEVPLPALLAALRRGEELVPLGDGSFGLLPEDWLKKYGLLGQMGHAEGDHLRFGATQVGLLDVLLAEQPEARFDEVFERARERLRRFEGVAPADPPAGFTGSLRGYQREGLGWLHFLREFGFGGCLADDMGLGKTVQVLALLEARRELRAAADGKGRGNGKAKGARTGPSLVVAPRSLVFNWKLEAARFAPSLRVLDHTGTGRDRSGDGFDDYDVVLTTYGTLRKDIAKLKDYPFDYAILDEAQAIKNASSQSAKASRLVRADHRLALSGTPVENHLGELGSLFEFLNPGMFGRVADLGRGDGGLRRPGEETRTLLARALRPFLLRRTKEQVASDLPEKTEQTIYCDLEPAQRKLYDELRAHYRQALLGRVASEGIAKAKIQILEALLRLRQAACHPGLIDPKRADDPSAKLDSLLPQLAEVVDGGHKALVFSQFTSLLAIVKRRLDAEGTTYAYLDGRTRDRQARVDQFQTDPACRVFLISLKAGGLGLNLTAADYVFLLDPWWNPAVEAQAIDRAHRIGQPRPVFAYRLIARGTVEEKVLQLQADKRALADAILTADNSLIRDLGREDLELLLS
jgi:superfamily II DNA or RNA helicase